MREEMLEKILKQLWQSVPEWFFHIVKNISAVNMTSINHQINFIFSGYILLCRQYSLHGKLDTRVVYGDPFCLSIIQ